MGKTAIVSDIHASTGSSPSWFVGPYIPATVKMLGDIATRPDIARLVLLGDIFDLWLYPVNVVPLKVSQIAESIPTFTAALRQCVASLPNVYYACGNHDMGVTPSELGPFASSGKSIQVLPAWDGWHLEHGHSVDMFNAPDGAQDTIGGYPLGFFITRLAAGAGEPSGFWNKVRQIVGGWFDSHLGKVNDTAKDELGSLFVQFLISSLANYAHVSPNTRIRFVEPALDNRYTIEDVANHYGSLLGTWWAKYPNPADLLSAMLTGLLPNGLDWYANALLSTRNPPKVLVMGHTHQAESVKVYANDGCSCSAGPAEEKTKYISYVTVDENLAEVITRIEVPPS